jgi:hypothetical protein
MIAPFSIYEENPGRVRSGVPVYQLRPVHPALAAVEAVGVIERPADAGSTSLVER